MHERTAHHANDIIRAAIANAAELICMTCVKRIIFANDTAIFHYNHFTLLDNHSIIIVCAFIVTQQMYKVNNSEDIL